MSGRVLAGAGPVSAAPLALLREHPRAPQSLQAAAAGMHAVRCHPPLRCLLAVHGPVFGREIGVMPKDMSSDRSSDSWDWARWVGRCAPACLAAGLPGEAPSTSTLRLSMRNGRCWCRVPQAISSAEAAATGVDVLLDLAARAFPCRDR